MAVALKPAFCRSVAARNAGGLLGLAQYFAAKRHCQDDPDSVSQGNALRGFCWKQRDESDEVAVPPQRV
jgi:hypothetical protein